MNKDRLYHKMITRSDSLDDLLGRNATFVPVNSDKTRKTISLLKKGGFWSYLLAKGNLADGKIGFGFGADPKSYSASEKALLQTAYIQRAIEVNCGRKRAINLLKDAIAIDTGIVNDPNRIRALYELAKVYFKRAEFDKAINELSTILGTGSVAQALDNGNIEAHNLLGEAYFKSKKWEEAIAHYQGDIGKNPNDVEAYYFLGGIFNSQGKIVESINYLENVFKVEKGHGYSSLIPKRKEAAALLRSLYTLQEAALENIVVQAPPSQDGAGVVDPNLDEHKVEQEQESQKQPVKVRDLQLGDDSYANLIKLISEGNEHKDKKEYDKAIGKYEEVKSQPIGLASATEEHKVFYAMACHNIGAAFGAQNKPTEAVRHLIEARNSILSVKEATSEKFDAFKKLSYNTLRKYLQEI